MRNHCHLPYLRKICMSIKIYQLAHREIIQQNQNAVIQVSNQRVFRNVLSRPPNKPSYQVEGRSGHFAQFGA